MTGSMVWGSAEVAWGTMVLGLLLHLLIRARPPTPPPSATAARLFVVFLLGTGDRRSPVQRLQGQGDPMQLIW